MTVREAATPLGPFLKCAPLETRAGAPKLPLRRVGVSLPGLETWP